MTSDDRAWARIASEQHGTLRRGAWYRVTDDSEEDTVSIEVRDMFVPIERHSITIRRDRPSYWSVVDRSEEDLEALQPEGWEFPVVYAVCPTCQARQEFIGAEDQKPDSMLCDVCGKRSEVDWTDTC